MHMKLSTTPLLRALAALDALSVGDAFGEALFGAPARIVERAAPPGPWRWTDDTQMALSVVEVLAQKGEIDQDLLARAFARRYEVHRGYGVGAHRLLEQLGCGARWQEASPALFGGGSYGNGGAMRVAPLGAWYAEAPLEEVAAAARRSAEVTHAHPEGIDGAVAVACAAAALWRDPQGPAAAVLAAASAALVTPRLQAAFARASSIARGEEALAVHELGTGERVSALDTAPFCVWMAAHHRESFEGTLWKTAQGLGDMDTTCAIVAGLIAPACPPPAAWLQAREALPELDLESR